MQTSQRGLALIKQFEGFSARPYLCPAGKWTIGYGHVIQEGEDFSAPITVGEAENMLKQDAMAYVRAINRLVNIEISQNQFDALVSLCYNIGIKAFEKSTLLRFLNQNRLDLAAAEFARWVYVNGKKNAGLIRRRAAERDFFEKDATFTKL